MLENGSLRNCCDPGGRGRFGLAEREAAGAPRPVWVVPVLSSVLIFTTVVDILGNLLVIISVFKNRKLRNSGKGSSPGRRSGSPGAPRAPWSGSSCPAVPSPPVQSGRAPAQGREPKGPPSCLLTCAGTSKPSVLGSCLCAPLSLFSILLQPLREECRSLSGS